MGGKERPTHKANTIEQFIELAQAPCFVFSRLYEQFISSCSGRHHRITPYRYGNTTHLLSRQFRELDRCPFAKQLAVLRVELILILHSHRNRSSIGQNCFDHRSTVPFSFEFCFVHCYILGRIKYKVSGRLLLSIIVSDSLS